MTITMPNAVHLLSVTSVLILAMAALCIAFVPESDAEDPVESYVYESSNESFPIRANTLFGIDPASHVQIVTMNGTISLSSDAISDLRTISSDVTLTMSGLTTEDLTPAQADKGCKMFSITLRNSDGTNHPLGGMVTVSLPYEPGYLEITSGISVKHVASDGTLTDMPTHYEEGCIVFETDHFSEFIIVPAYETYADLLLISLSILTLLAVGVLVLFLLRMRKIHT